jgi:hypothetical protein
MYVSGERLSTPPSTPPRETPSLNGHEKIGTQVSEMVSSLKRISELQLSIWLKQVKNAVMRITLFAGLSAVAFVFVVMAVIFLYAGVFHVLTDVLHIPTVWALMIFAGVHLVIAGILFLVAVKMLQRMKTDKKPKAAKA